MRVVSFIMAIVVAAGLYLWVIERDATLAFIAERTSDSTQAYAADTAETAQAEEVAAAAEAEAEATEGAALYSESRKTRDLMG